MEVRVGANEQVVIEASLQEERTIVVNYWLTHVVHDTAQTKRAAQHLVSHDMSEGDWQSSEIYQKLWMNSSPSTVLLRDRFSRTCRH